QLPPQGGKAGNHATCTIDDSLFVNPAGRVSVPDRRVAATWSNAVTVGTSTVPTATTDVVAIGHGHPESAGPGDQALSAFAGRFCLGLSFGDGQIDHEAERLGDVCGCGHNLRRSHDGGDGDEHALYILER